MKKKNVLCAIAVIAVTFFGIVITFRTKDPVLGKDPKSVATLTRTISARAWPITSSVASPSQLAAGRNSFPPPQGDDLIVWNFSGELDGEIVIRYHLSPDQIESFHRLKSVLLERVQDIEARNSTVKFSPDRTSVSIEIKSDANSAKDFSNYYQGELRRILGDVAYADLTKYLDTPMFDSVLNAGLLEKQISIEKLPPTFAKTNYHMKIDAAMPVESDGGSKTLFDKHTTEMTGTRPEIARYFLAITKVLPADF